MGKKSKKDFVDLMQVPSEVTGSLIFCNVTLCDKTVKFVVDCGFFQESEYEDRNRSFPFKASEIDFVLITHLHLDHIGRLPFLRKKGFSGKIYMTDINCRLISRTLQSCSKIVQRNAKKSDEPALYTSNDVDEVISLVEGYEYNHILKINENIAVTFIKNGHLPGSASILIEVSCPEGRMNFFFTGDYHGKNLFFRVPPLSKKIKELPMHIITECTYGYTNSDCIKEVFQKNILKALRKGKKIVIPAFSMGRFQECLYKIKVMQKKYPKEFSNVKIACDGKLALYYTDAYRQLINDGVLKFYKNKVDFLPENLIRVENTIIRKQILADDACKIIIATSGSGSFGSSQTYISNFISNENALIHYTGYCSPGTLGYRLKSAEKGDIVVVGGEEREKLADIKFTNEFSKHAKCDELIDLLKNFKNPISVYITHGEDKTKDIFGECVIEEIPVEKFVGILGREHYFRIYPDNTVKAQNSKF